MKTYAFRVTSIPRNSGPCDKESAQSLSNPKSPIILISHFNPTVATALRNLHFYDAGTKDVTPVSFKILMKKPQKCHPLRTGGL